MGITWFESVPSGLRWFCDDCSAIVCGLSELDRAEAERVMEHQPDCPSYRGDPAP